jgi:hypothetical protein
LKIAAIFLKSSYGVVLGAGDGFAATDGAPFGAGGAAGIIFMVGGTVAVTEAPVFAGATTGGVSGFAVFKNVRSNWLASMAA